MDKKELLTVWLNAINDELVNPTGKKKQRRQILKRTFTLRRFIFAMTLFSHSDN